MNIIEAKRLSNGSSSIKKITTNMKHQIISHLLVISAAMILASPSVGFAQPNGQGSGANLPNGMVPQQRVTQESAAKYPNLLIFLEATRQGVFLPIDRINREGQDVVARSIISILRTDYGVSSLPNDSACYEQFKAQSLALLSQITAANVASLGNQPPDFVNINIDINTSTNQLANELKSLQAVGDWCDTKVLGQYRQHSYKQALPKLLTEYGQATQQWVETERNRRKVAYLSQQRQAKSEADQRQREVQARDANRRVEEQKRIDTERARIEQEQKQRDQKEKNRVSG